MKGLVIVLLIGWGFALIVPPQKVVAWVRGKTS